jgi:hypothetical protein
MAHAMAHQPGPLEREMQIDMVRRLYGWEQVADSMSLLYAGLLRAGGLTGDDRIRTAQPRSITK